MTILPITYLGNTAWWSHLLSDECVIDIGENWIKQSARNRCEIVTPNGVATLSVNVCGRGERVATRDVRIDYSKRWQHQHSVALRSAYKSSPYYDYYADRLEPFFERRYEFLYDFNRELVDVVRGIAGIREELRYSEEYIVASPADEDLRGYSFLGTPTLLNRAPLPIYWQVFSERIPFEPNLSIIDYIFNEGK